MKFVKSNNIKIAEDLNIAFREIQRGIVHQIRNSLNGVAWKAKKAFASDLKSIYTLLTEESGYKVLELVKENL